MPKAHTLQKVQHALSNNVVVEEHQEEGNDNKVVQHHGGEDVDDQGWLHGEGAVGYINVKNYGRLENCCIPQVSVCTS